MGCGRVGSSLAASLDRLGHEVAVIDQDRQAFRRLAADFAGRQVVGLGFDREVLVEAGIERAQAFAAVSSGDNSNIIAARVARETFGVARVVARIYDAKRGGRLRAARHPDRGHRAVDHRPAAAHAAARRRGVGVARPHRHGRDPPAAGPRGLGRPPGARAGGGHRVRAWRSSSGSASACCRAPETFVQDDDPIYVAAVSGTVSDVTSAAAAPPPQEG